MLGIKPVAAGSGSKYANNWKAVYSGNGTKVYTLLTQTLNP